ncbi:MAG: lipoate--protein ligase [Prolixibacteraceae bacterium]|jgi:lipoate-protein ligase A|nr:lipoate--protein ligase [Prolixibacteraceae bacterium]
MITFCLKHNSLDPWFNLAAEEYLLKNFTEDFFIIWRSERSVVVGKHQNALAEINHEFVHGNHIHVARRLSGGGTVFHDQGNVNFTFIRGVKEISEVNFKIFTQPIVKSLQKLGVGAYPTGRNDLAVNGKKISGNAGHVYKKRVLHHGTLLFNSDLSKLKDALNVDLSRFEDKSVQSNRSPVTNISDFLKVPMTVDEFSEFIFDDVPDVFQDKEIYRFSEHDVAAISTLRDQKYASWDWVYGYSPKYVFRNKVPAPSGEIAVEMMVVKGIIQEIKTDGLPSGIPEMIIGKRHRIEDFQDLPEAGLIQKLLF